MSFHERDIVNDVIGFLDIFVILLLEEDPILSLVLVALLKTVTEDKLIRISFILLIIFLGVSDID
ncbi:hypothetical protein E2R51_12810 [Jeotgalibacillus sp. S-D1]|uniref:hypothetical protein n=1 Tax=Jeotgalibacillus sp. S-D1 TaxID=2552189 RepID=UPI0010594E62|nr:hypothetical protein [Jeotgalibacillus sp. S-D1]TDL31251.1 hypothetical protein E2R51_12810 [Jeotgalibacillus sp. S-D1]